MVENPERRTLNKPVQFYHDRVMVRYSGKYTSKYNVNLLALKI